MNPNAQSFKPTVASTTPNKENVGPHGRGALLRGGTPAAQPPRTASPPAMQAEISSSVTRGQSSGSRSPLSTLYEAPVGTASTASSSAFRRPPPLPTAPSMSTGARYANTPVRATSPHSPNRAPIGGLTGHHYHYPPYANAPSPGMPMMVNMMQTPLKVTVGVGLPMSNNQTSSASPNRFFFNAGAAAVSASPNPSNRSHLSYSAPRAMSPNRYSAAKNRNDDEEGIQRRVEQREKQITYGYNTPGYRNMQRLVVHDPRLRSGGVIPIPPPEISIRSSKRAWDVLIRKWRRALHMFDYVFIDGTDDEKTTTREEMLEQQRLKWVSPIHHIVEANPSPARRFSPEQSIGSHQPQDQEEPVVAAPSAKITTGPRVVLSMDLLMSRRNAPSVPTKIPVEECLRRLLRSESCYEPLATVIPEQLLYHTRHNKFSVADVGFKIVIAPSTVIGPYASARSPSPEVPDFAPTQLVNNGVPMNSKVISSPTSQRPTTAAFAEIMAMGVSSPVPSSRQRAEGTPITANGSQKRTFSPTAAPWAPSISNSSLTHTHQLGGKPTPFRCQLARSSVSPMAVSPSHSISNVEGAIRVDSSSAAATNTEKGTSASLTRSSKSLGHEDPTMGAFDDQDQEPLVKEGKLAEVESESDLTMVMDLQGRY